MARGCYTYHQYRCLHLLLVAVIVIFECNISRSSISNGWKIRSASLLEGGDALSCSSRYEHLVCLLGCHQQVKFVVVINDHTLVLLLFFLLTTLPSTPVAGLEVAPRKVTRSMNKKKIIKRSRVKPFIKHLNYNHILPTRYVAVVARWWWWWLW